MSVAASILITRFPKSSIMAYGLDSEAVALDNTGN